MGQEDPTPTMPTPASSDATAEKKVKHLVLDTGALIKGQGYRLAALAEHFWTIPEVIAEVRDPRARFHLSTLPFELRTKEPSPEACKAVADFARKTGDYSALSKVDLRVLALTYTMEAQELGSVAHLRTTLATPAAVAAAGKPTAASSARPVGKEGEEEVKQEEEGEQERVYVEVEGDSEDEEEEDESGEESSSGSDDDEEEEEEEASASATQEEATPTAAAAPAPAATVKAGFSWAQAVKSTASKPPPPPNAVKTRRQKEDAEGPAIPIASLDLNKEKEDGLLPPQTPVTKTTKPSEVTSRFLGAAGRTAATVGKEAGDKGEEEDDGEGWISVENIKEVRARGTETLFGARKGDGYTGAKVSDAAAPPPPVVACVTTDFGMQNVLLQMGLRLLSLDGVAVTRVKQWARRCESCAKIVHDQERMFCPRCGNAYLSRVSISVDSTTGQLRVHLSKLWRPRRGCKYSIPKAPKGKTGRWEGDLLLREDQLQMGIWQQKVKRRTKALDSMFGSDITETLGVAVTKTAAADGIQFGYGRKNPNSQRGRERRGKKKKNHA